MTRDHSRLACLMCFPGYVLPASRSLTICRRLTWLRYLPRDEFGRTAMHLPSEPPGWVPHARDFMLAEPFLVDEQGYIAMPQKPGLGIELDMERIRSCSEQL